MELSHYLHTAGLLSCTGEVTHQLTLLPNGHVQIEIGSVTAVVDPATQSVLRPRGYVIPAEVMNHAATLARAAQ